ncbi:hypothetical protein RFN28_30100 [Mesorhizobium sp. VK24D]|uniref:Uncharacterized protein n=1 Tax=Mesorhizobium album TaxID=3072314 RepID=A0ABU4Y9R9_9HYPH|nr:hypothetical protein [Mesorhizobium sp. VK24D]MDX8482679.1 hypothetical protein [Mesorhizobium sp. VK24D]
MKDVFSTAAIIVSIAVVIVLMLMAPKGFEANPSPVVTSDQAGLR